MFSVFGRTDVYCHKGHRFDLNDDRIQSGRKLTNGIPESMRPKIIQPGTVKFDVQVKENLVKALKAKYGDGLEATVNAALANLMDEGAFIVNGERVQQLAEQAGVRIQDAATLCGVLAAKRLELEAAHKELEKLRANASVAGKPQAIGPAGGVLVMLSDDAVTTMRARCDNYARPMAEVLGEFLEGAIKNDWV